jgi:hypothetical protein
VGFLGSLMLGESTYRALQESARCATEGKDSTTGKRKAERQDAGKVRQMVDTEIHRRAGSIEAHLRHVARRPRFGDDSQALSWYRPAEMRPSWVRTSWKGSAGQRPAIPDETGWHPFQSAGNSRRERGSRYSLIS